ncbi:TetR family transcriptional regulator [Saccharopolyspora erythraea NRRL 2338]|uniref:Transcriptional regulator (TetR/AcrR family) n=2 Tax=Saccharopolyspora erythraea TaxID=1836 RepID=A4FNA5_SACEN|nr:TetR/AcrR family transcriptional regulator [Saccharopolyspora erythraea]EQD87089.1 TetR family transcriptional regulator [Saccharopolyspora erythraea D]PFG99169.1 TetR family transcriptional regulator [Saccharopolyspora erythraea NRRL 2338]QRK89119.1 TetR/AcrR family transcriptional regulator [Saccharopolyspora erythraea]CAM05530.1 transcriptional regulator (TetR/AcrR family) [Saccharopolyspora erythraea NRRL 2338]
METQQAVGSSARPAGRKRLPRAERERQILAVAEEVFARDGYQDTSMDDIAQRVGLSKPMLYEYFGSKEGLLLACLEKAKRELLESTMRAAEKAVGPEQLLHDCLLSFFRFGEEHAQAWALLRNESAVPSSSVHTELESIRLQQTELTASLMRVARPDLEPLQLEAFAEAIIGACERLALWRERRPEITPQDATRHLMTLLLPSLSPPAP